MKRLTAAVAIVALSSLLTACEGSSEEAALFIAPIATDQLVFDSDRTGNYEIFVMRADGGGVKQLTADTAYDSWWPRLSPDRRKVLFYRSPATVHDTDYARTSLWVMNADGSGVTRLRDIGMDGWALQGHAEWSPSGNHLTMFGGPGLPQIYVTRADGTQPRRVTDGTGIWVDPSWSPDGTRLVFAGCTPAPCTYADFEIYTLDSDGAGGLIPITSDSLRDHDPYYSPDGTRIAWLTETDPSPFPGVWNIRIANSDGSALANVTNDANINSKPDWSTDGSYIYFHRLIYTGVPVAGWNLYRVRPDGTGMTLLPGQTGNNEFPDN